MHHRTFPRGICSFGLAVACFFLALCAPSASAQSATSAPVTPVVGTNGGPERVALVVNGNSWASQTVANEYIRLRHVPACNVIYIDTKDWPSFETTNLEFFKTRLLSPVLDEIKKRGLTSQIDCIAYSSDFPFYIGGSSLTGLTYLHEMVLSDGGAKNPRSSYLAMDANWYFHSQSPYGQLKGFDASPIAFSSQTAWDQTGKAASGPGGRHYLLSTMLAYTSGRGNSVTEAVNCLRRAASADGTSPKGTIIYANNDGIRADVRRWGFDGAIAKLKGMGVGADKTGDFRDANGNPDYNHNPDLPKGTDPVAGLMLGRAVLRYRDCKNPIVPGAIIENMTSFGGGMGWNDEYQTCISDFIRLGAVGTSGTVDEPGATQTKFPTPYMQVHYAAGCTLAEAYYQSICQPYQTLIIGDPLCEPWAKIPQVSIKGVTGEIKIDGKYVITPEAKAGGPKISHYEIFVDGKFVDKIQTGKGYELVGAKLGDGWHEVRLTAVAAGPLQTRGGCIVWAQVGDDSKQLTCTAKQTKAVWGDPVSLGFTAPVAHSVEFFCNSRPIHGVLGGDGPGRHGECGFDAAQLGMGVCRIQAVATLAGGGKLPGKPIEIEVLPPPLHAALTDVPADDKLSPGLLLWAKGKTPYVVTNMRKWPTIEVAKIDRKEPFEFDGFFEASADDVYQFQIMFTGKLDVKIDGQDFPLPAAGKSWRLVPISLAKGTHRFQACGASTDSRDMEFRFGASGVRCPYVLAPKEDNASRWPVTNFRHLTSQEK